jgi:predicted RNA-binding protein YlxR (DUF448 family)
MEGKPKKELIRIVRTPEGDIRIDKTGKAAGRGAYICDDVECLNKVQKKKALNRAFQQDVGEEIYMKLQEELGHDG